MLGILVKNVGLNKYMNHGYWLKRINNRCRCGKIVDCVVLGKTRDKQDIFEKVIGYDCKFCGIQKKVDVKKLKEYL